MKSSVNKRTLVPQYNNYINRKPYHNCMVALILYLHISYTKRHSDIATQIGTKKKTNKNL